jgi:hypothetical protein
MMIGSKLAHYEITVLVLVKTAAAFSAGAPRELFEAPVQPCDSNDGHR